jgi:hypothetical protein
MLMVIMSIGEKQKLGMMAIVCFCSFQIQEIFQYEWNTQRIYRFHQRLVQPISYNNTANVCQTIRISHAKNQALAFRFTVRALKQPLGRFDQIEVSTEIECITGIE